MGVLTRRDPVSAYRPGLAARLWPGIRKRKSLCLQLGHRVWSPAYLSPSPTPPAPYTELTLYQGLGFSKDTELKSDYVLLFQI